MRIDEYARRYTATISGVIRKTNCGRRFTLLDLLVAGILQRGQPDERKVWAYNTAYMCLLLHKEYDMLTVWKGGECVIQSRSNLTPDEDDPSWLEAYRFTVWEVEANAKLHAVLQCPASLNKITRDIKRLCCLNGFLFSHYTRFQFDMSRHARFDQRTDFDQRRDPPHLSWTWEFEFWLSLKGRHYKCITNAFHGMTCSSKIRDFFFHSGMPESSAKILPISQYAWELMNMLEDTRPQSQVWSERPIAAADSLFWIFWWQGFCKEARMKRLSWRKIIDTSGVSPFCQDAKIMQDWWGRSAPLVAAFVLQETMACLCYDMLHFFCVLFPSCLVVLCRAMSCSFFSRCRGFAASWQPRGRKRWPVLVVMAGLWDNSFLEDFWRFLVRRKH